MIARILNFRDRDAILQAARTLPALSYQGAKVIIFPDYTKEVQVQRRSYYSVKQKLRALDLPYRLLFPARLRVILQNKTHFFDNPEAA